VENYKELSRALEIDESDLDGEAIRYSSCFFRVSVGFREAGAAFNDASDELKRIESEIGDEANKKMVGRVTVAIRNDYVRGHKDYQQVRRDYQLAKASMAKWEALVEAWRQKSYQLRILADLWIHEYWSTETGSGTRRNRDAGSDRQERNTSRVRKQIRQASEAKDRR
jgi:hypothetical protein